MKNWMPDASERFESYKRRVRLAVAGNPTVNADDVLQDIQAHVDAELGPTVEPVTVGALERVLETLGSPSQWTDAPADSEPQPGLLDQVRRFGAKWETRLAGEWGSPVLLVLVTLLGLITIESVGILLLAFAYFMGRAMLRHASTPITGTRRLLTLVPVVLISALIVGVAVATPLLFAGRNVTFREATFGLGSWWLLLGFAASREPARVRAGLAPLADWFEPSHGRLMMVFGGGMLALALVNILT